MPPDAEVSTEITRSGLPGQGRPIAKGYRASPGGGDTRQYVWDLADEDLGQPEAGQPACCRAGSPDQPAAEHARTAQLAPAPLVPAGTATYRTATSCPCRLE